MLHEGTYFVRFPKVGIEADFPREGRFLVEVSAEFPLVESVDLDIPLEDGNTLREFRKKAEKESIIEFIGEPTKDGCMSRGNLEETMKSFSSMDVINADSDTDVEMYTFLSGCFSIGIRALSYRELGCIRRRPTLGLLVLPSVSPFPPIIRRTARISMLQIEPNLAERAIVSVVNLDDYQLDPREEALTAYGTEIGQNSVPALETALTVCTTRLRGQFHTILEDMDCYPNACLEELEAFLTLWDVKPRVEESSLETLSVDELITQLRQVCEDAEDHASNAQEEARQKRKEALEEVV
ncbi:hypothetical protein Tco_0769078 [Tanacetum coccineum]|uniref:Uncharacterized protein n=1 Tax=Tanacetum coccineum TaxID=301880 RepID=A0ABQ4ZBT6_9ASTR